MRSMHPSIRGTWIMVNNIYVGRKYVNLTDAFVLGKKYFADSFALQQNGPVTRGDVIELIILWIVASVLLHHALVF